MFFIYVGKGSELFRNVQIFLKNSVAASINDALMAASCYAWLLLYFEGTDLATLTPFLKYGFAC